MKDDFSNGPSRAALANEPGQQIRVDFSNGPGRAGKREMSFPTAGLGYKEIKTINIARQSRPIKERLSFQTGK